MAAIKPNVEDKFRFQGSEEEWNALSESEKTKYQVLAADIMALRDAHIGNADLLDRAELKWYAGFTLLNTWALDAEGRKVSYHAHSDATTEQLASTVPGSNGSVWVRSEGQPDTDFVAAYNAAKT